MESKREVSAGGIVYCFSSGSPQILLIKDPKNNWTFPKGLIEKDEDPQKTARREITEETGISDIVFVKSLGEVEYFYTFENFRIKKTVYYFLFKTDKINHKLLPQKEEGITEVKFFSFEKTFQIIGYAKTNLPILNTIKAFFQKEEKKKIL